MPVKGLLGEQDREQDGFRKALWKETIPPVTPLVALSRHSKLALFSCSVSAIGYVTPADKMAGREPAIFAERDRKLDAARQRRRAARAASRAAV